MKSIIVMLLLVLTPTYSQDYFSFGMPLKGVKNIFFRVGIEGKDGNDLDMFENKLKNDIELKLRLANINIVYDVVKSDGILNVYLKAASIRNKSNDEIAYVVSYIIQFNSWVTLKSKKQMYATTWDKIDNLITGGKEGVLDLTRESVKDNMDKFIIDYLDVNKK